MGWREDFRNFDMSRLTLVGLLVFLLSIAVGIGAALVVDSYWVAWFPPQQGARPRRIGPAGIAGCGGAVGFFFLVKAVLGLAGVRTVRPKEDLSALSNEQASIALQRQVRRARAWRLFFSLLTPLGFIVPCGLALAFAPSLNRPAAEGMSASALFGMLAFGLPVIGVIGWVLMHGDVKKKSKELAARHDNAG